MLNGIRFGNVAMVKGLSKEEAEGMKSPQNRVLFTPKYCTETFIVTGQEDVLMTDTLLILRNQNQQPAQSKVNEALKHSLYRFLISKAINKDISNDTGVYEELFTL